MPTIDPKRKQEQNWKRRYGITRRIYEKLLEHQNGVCAACGGLPDTKNKVFMVDHDHESGDVRGLLCKSCNTALGNGKDDPWRFERLKLYLETHKPEPVLPADQLVRSPTVEKKKHTPPAELVVKDPRIPTPEVVAALKLNGATLAEIAEEFQIAVTTAKRLLSDAERGTAAEWSRDWLYTRVLPKALVTIDEAVSDGNAKVAVEIAKGLGALRPVKDELAPSPAGVRTFEEWRATLTHRVVREGEPPVEPSVDTIEGVVVTQAPRHLREEESSGPPEGDQGSRHGVDAIRAEEAPTSRYSF